MDWRRWVYSLAGRLRARPWVRHGVAAFVRELAGADGRRAVGLGERIVAAFPERPGFAELARFVLADERFVQSLMRPYTEVQRARLLLRRSRAFVVRVRRVDAWVPEGLGGLRLPVLKTEVEVAGWLGVNVPRLQWLADVTGRNRRAAMGSLRTYRYQWVAKRSGGERLLEIPKGVLMRVQRRILEELLNRVPVHEAVHGFRAGRSIVSNAAVHCGKRVVVRMDLQDFFASVTAARIFRIFLTLGYSPSVARLLMGLCTTSVPADVCEGRCDFAARQRLRTRHLPQGAPTSPALANLAAMRLDRRLSALAASIGANYSRYADDLAFSGEDALGQRARRLEVVAASAALEEGFAVNHRKTRVMRAGGRQEVAGVVVNVRPNVRREEFDRLKAILTNCVRHGAASQNRQGVADFRGHLLGRLAHLANVNPRRGERLRKLFGEIAWEVHT